MRVTVNESNHPCTCLYVYYFLVDEGQLVQTVLEHVQPEQLRGRAFTQGWGQDADWIYPEQPFTQGVGA